MCQVNMVTAAKYPIEKFTIQTDDNYLLALYRIPSSPKMPLQKVNREAVLLINGILLSSIDYIVAGPGKALGKPLPHATEMHISPYWSHSFAFDSL